MEKGGRVDVPRPLPALGNFSNAGSPAVFARVLGNFFSCFNCRREVGPEKTVPFVEVDHENLYLEHTPFPLGWGDFFGRALLPYTTIIYPMGRKGKG